MQDWVARIRAGDMRALARACTAIENGEAEGRALLEEITAAGRRALIAGITGPPGAGKSSLVDAMVHSLRRQDKTAAIVAVDPSSALSGGAILGDRIRMQRHHADDGVFVRSMATRGSLGGLAPATASVARLLAAAGRDVVFIETVGVGQDEVSIAAVADVTVVVLVPGLGDDIQTIKAGLMEIAGIFVVNKSDQPGAELVEQQIRAALSLSEGRVKAQPPVLRTSAATGEGVDELLQCIFDVGEAARRRKEPEALHAAPAPERPAAASKNPAIRIDHIGVAVESLDTALAFYTTQLGIPPIGRETVPQEQVEVAMLELAGSRLELLQPAAPNSPVGRFLERRGPGIHHLALRVPDLDAAVERLKRNGARILNEARPGAGGHLYVFIHPASTGGVLLELIQEDR